MCQIPCWSFEKIFAGIFVSPPSEVTHCGPGFGSVIGVDLGEVLWDYVSSLCNFFASQADAILVTSDFVPGM